MSEAKSVELTIPAKAYGTDGPTQALKPMDIKRKPAGPNDIVIHIKYCGICHSDIHTARDEWHVTKYPCIPGHEIAGVVREIGSAVTKYKVGDHVGVGCFVNSCRTCEYCKLGEEQYCSKGMIGTYNSTDPDTNTTTYGGYTTVLTINEDYALRIDPKLDLAKVAPLLCAGITVYSPLAHWKAGPGKKVAVVGMGGLGHMAVKLGVAMGADVTVLSSTLGKKDDAIKFGASAMYATKDPETFTKLASSFDLIINTVSANIDYNAYLMLLRVDGTMVCVGAPEHPTPVASFPLIFGRRSLAGSLIGGIKETQEMLDLCAAKNILPEIEIIPASKINEAYERIMKSDVRYRFVIDAATY